ncbi:hypothetical protein C2G38_2152075 [Gigaspora rosea]|uniref:Protein kinase domain-containing protein n=1 Tax=Gigaspora rosea TaxID=44941 RepID=A0A397WCE9_9GLOM|nr:hypothetical protein C2G38_2152075 [Gigaspora rosea]
MTNIAEEWLEKAISDGHINYIEYNKLINPVEIGIGGFGKVFKYEWKECELTVALKCLKVDTNIDEKIIKDFIDELKLLRKVSCHPNVITFYAVTKDNYGHYNMILEYANEGTLREYLKINSTKLRWADKLCIAKELAHGLLFLHNSDIIHRDLHSKNILIHQSQPKITDFGLSKQINENSSTSSSIIHGMPAYIEPQCFIDQKYKRDKRSDVYSFGVILWEISSGRPPFQTFKPNDYSLVIHISNGNREEPIEGTPSQYIELYKKCWDKDPDNRPETSVIFNDIKQLVLNETFDQYDPIEASSENNEVSLSHQYNTNALADSLEIKTWSPLYLTDTNNSNSLIQNNSIIENLRKETIEFFNQPKFLKAFEVLCKNSTLTSLDFDEDLGTEGGKALADALCKNNTLTSLFLAHNYLGSEGVKALADALCKNSTLTSLELTFEDLGPEGVKALADALCKNSTLKDLNLGYNNFGSEGGKALADALCKNSTLTSLDLSWNKLGSKGGKALADALCKNSTLASLNLEQNDLGSEGVKALADALCKNTSLISLDLSYNELGSEGVKALADALCKNSTLTSLNLRRNDLGSEGGKALADALCMNSTLTSLNLQENDLGSEGGKALADALCKNSTLKELNLAYNNLGSEGVKALADALGKNSTLTYLDLRSNLGSEALANALYKNFTLTSFNLVYNYLRSEGVKALADALCKNSTLKELELSYNNLGSEGGKALADALCANSTLTFLNISENSLSFKLVSNNPNLKIVQYQ